MKRLPRIHAWQDHSRSPSVIVWVEASPPAPFGVSVHAPYASEGLRRCESRGVGEGESGVYTAHYRICATPTFTLGKIIARVKVKKWNKCSDFVPIFAGERR